MHKNMVVQKGTLKKRVCNIITSIFSFGESFTIISLVDTLPFVTVEICTKRKKNQNQIGELDYDVRKL